MPNLNERQFRQLSLDRDVGPLQRTEFSGKGAALDSIKQREVKKAKEAEAREKAKNPGPDYHRGTIPGQRVMNFDVPEASLEYAGPESAYYPASIHVNERTDPDFSTRLFNVGGAYRVHDSDLDIGMMAPGEGTEAAITSVWDGSPVETFGPEAEIRSGQSMVDEHTVEDLRDVPYQDYHDKPWIARVAGKNYMLDGHHRATAGRRSRKGEFDAHVIEADDVDNLINKIRGEGASKIKETIHRYHPSVEQDSAQRVYTKDFEGDFHSRF